MDLLLIDAIGPFFIGTTRARINWSKIPFADFLDGSVVREDRLAALLPQFETFCARIRLAGYTGITLDDVAHLADHLSYPPQLRTAIAAFRRRFAPLLDCAQRHGLRVFVTTDATFVPVDAGRELRRQALRPDFLAGLVQDLFDWRPDLSGVIVRVGESDGLDVRDLIRSELRIRTASQCRALIDSVLSVCEQHGKTLIFRTWTVGAYRIGDLLWNPRTCLRIFEPFAARALVVSMKYGETDFFRFLALNRNFLHGSYRKMIELQGRREYEGCGEYPSFIGWEYDRHLRELRARGVDLAGVTVWCQTGGWTRFRRLTFIEPAGLWNEINVWVIARLLGAQDDVETAIGHWCRHHGRAGKAYDILHLLRLSDEVVRELLYIDEFARQSLFFRRLRLPPLLWVFWDRIIVNRALALLLDLVVRDTRRLLRTAEEAMQKFPRMEQLAARADLPVADIRFMHDTFAILAAARRWLLGPHVPGELAALRRQVRDYAETHPNHYTVHLEQEDARPSLRRASARRLLRLLVRREHDYRWIDRIVTLRLLAWLYPLVRCRLRVTPDFARDTAMGIDTLFK